MWPKPSWPPFCIQTEFKLCCDTSLQPIQVDTRAGEWQNNCIILTVVTSSTWIHMMHFSKLEQLNPMSLICPKESWALQLMVTLHQSCGTLALQTKPHISKVSSFCSFHWSSLEFKVFAYLVSYVSLFQDVLFQGNGSFMLTTSGPSGPWWKWLCDAGPWKLCFRSSPKLHGRIPFIGCQWEC